MAEGQHDRTATLPCLSQTIKSLDAAAVHPFGSGQPFREELKEMVQVTVLVRLPRGSSGSRGPQKIRQGRKPLGFFESGVENGTHKNKQIQNPVETPDGEKPFRSANDEKEQQPAGGLESFFHGTESHRATNS